MPCNMIPELLLDDIKNYLDVTWQDRETDRKLAGLIQEGIAYIDGFLGRPGDYLSPGMARTLLKEYVRYARDGARDVFETNYLSLLLAAGIGGDADA
nr:MAG TPA: head to tail adaptor [Caudoviricetes sp.]